MPQSNSRAPLPLLCALSFGLECLVAPALHAEEPRTLPDYDGREEPAATPGEVLLWIPRILLSPVYFVSEFLLRRPLGLLIAGAERAGVPAFLYDFFTFSAEHKAGVIPTAYVDFDFYPSVGLYAFWDDVGFDGNDLRLRGAFGGREWLSASVAERFRFTTDPHNRVAIEASAERRPDFTFFGLGPDSRQDDLTRYGQDTLELRASWDQRLWRVSALRVEAALRKVRFRRGGFGGDAVLDDAITAGEVPSPPGYRGGYELLRSTLGLAFDSRRPRPAPGSGVRLATELVDAREQNTMDSWIASDPSKPDSSPGYVRHYYLDTSDSFGSEWFADGISRRLGNSYLLDFGHVALDFVTLGSIERPWERAERTPGFEIFGYYHYRDFDPEAWKNEYPNPAFSRATEPDNAWMARILSRLDRVDIEALVSLGKFSQPEHAAFLSEVLEHRLQKVLERYLLRLSPLSDPRLEGDTLCILDLARRRALRPGAFRYTAFAADTDGTREVAVDVRGAGESCLRLPHSSAGDLGVAAAHPSRYLVVTLANGVSTFPVRVHLYDLGAHAGFKLVGLERPEQQGDNTNAPKRLAPSAGRSRGARPSLSALGRHASARHGACCVESREARRAPHFPQNR